LVRKLVRDLFKREPHCELNPDEVVALGAAVQANILAGGSQATENMLLLDVTPLSLGIEALGGVVARIIHRNSTIPASATEHFTTGVDGQTSVAIHVVQGERELAKDCRSLARFDLKGVPPMPAGLPRIEVRFLIDANGILHVSAREHRSGKAAEIEVQPSYGLSDEQVENMILESFDYAEKDLLDRQLIEARHEAETILAALKKGKQSPAFQQIPPPEREQIWLCERELKAVRMQDDPRKLGDAPPSRTDDGYRGEHGSQRQIHGECRSWRRSSGAASHRQGGIRVTRSSDIRPAWKQLRDEPVSKPLGIDALCLYFSRLRLAWKIGIRSRTITITLPPLRSSLARTRFV
jgi:molecular chaperone DnaK (HSP70)